MLNILSKIFSVLGTLLMQGQVEMATNFRSEGKIYVVIGIILVILIGFFFLLFRLDKRAKRIEKEVKER
jgi:cytochrome c biogenesis factor